MRTLADFLDDMRAWVHREAKNRQIRNRNRNAWTAADEALCQKQRDAQRAVREKHVEKLIARRNALHRRG